MFHFSVKNHNNPNLGKPKTEYIKSFYNILFGFGLAKLGI
jgi:hypothetical protein